MTGGLRGRRQQLLDQDDECHSRGDPGVQVRAGFFDDEKGANGEEVETGDTSFHCVVVSFQYLLLLRNRLPDDETKRSSNKWYNM